jgi:hypothetical protein
MKSRGGTVLVVMIGITAILGSLTLALALRVKSSMSDRGLIQRHAQAYMMMQASAIYLNRHWNLDGQAPEHASGNNRVRFSNPNPLIGSLTGGLCAGLIADYPLAGRLGWYKIVLPNVVNAEYFITAVGGGSQAESIPAKIPTEIRYFLKYSAGNSLPQFSQIFWPDPITSNWQTGDPVMWP